MATIRRTEEFLKNEKAWENFLQQNDVLSEGVVHIAELEDGFQASSYIAPVMYPAILKVLKSIDNKAFVEALIYISNEDGFEIEDCTPEE